MAEEVKSTAEGAEQPAEKTYTEAEYTALQTQLGDVQKQLDEANTTIKSYTDMDIEGIKQSAADWKQKAEKLEAERKSRDYSDKLDRFVKAQGMRNEIYAAYLKSQLTAAELKFDKDGTLIGGEDIVKKLRESFPEAFQADRPQIDIGGSTRGIPVGDAGFAFNFEGVRPHTK